MDYIGIDISKQYFDVAIFKGGGYQHFKFENNTKGFRKLGALAGENDCCVMEASGPYYQRLATWLFCSQKQVSVVNPLVIHRFCQMRLTRAKTDKKDAVMIAEYGKAEHPAVWEPREDFMLELKQMHALLLQLDKSRTGYIRQKEAFAQSPAPSKEVLKSIALLIRTTQKQIRQLEQQMEQIITRHYPEMYRQLKSIPGIGKKTAVVLIMASGGFKTFGSAKQLSSYFGLSPRIFESGSSVKGKAKICKMGMGTVRAKLYMCSLSAKKYNAACKSLYERLVEKGKAKMIALIAVANKLIHQAFAIVTKNQFYDPHFITKH